MDRYVVLVGINDQGRDSEDNPAVQIFSVDAKSEDDAAEIVAASVQPGGEPVTVLTVYEGEKFLAMAQELVMERADLVQG